MTIAHDATPFERVGQGVLAHLEREGSAVVQPSADGDAGTMSGRVVLVTSTDRKSVV